jgi:hypothetical protein
MIIQLLVGVLSVLSGIYLTIWLKAYVRELTK